AVVANGTGQHHLDVVPPCFVGDPFFEQACLNRFLHGAKSSDGVDGSQMVAVSAFDLLAGGQVDAKRGAEERRLDVVGDDGIAAKDDLYVATANQLGDVASRTGMDDCRAEYE